MRKREIKFIEYAGNDINKWKKILGFNVIHIKIKEIGIGRIIKLKRDKRGEIFITINFKNNHYDSNNIKIIKHSDLEKFCSIYDLNTVTEFMEYINANNGTFPEVVKEVVSMNEYVNKDTFGNTTYKECIEDVRLLYDITYKEESMYLSKTLNYLGKDINKMKSQISQLDEDCKYYYSPTFVERQEMAERRDERRVLINKNEKAIKIYKKPYFGRVDIVNWANRNDEIYIGYNEIIDGGETIVWDWRNELAQRYYRKNELEFILNGKKHKTTLIRSIDIKDAKIQSINDDYVRGIDSDNDSISDPFLIKIIKEKRNQKEITNIISSIQQNQNKIITSNLNDNVIVQGCAGSGKTMILLHKLSYLIYNNKNINLDRVKVITPNNIFKLSINSLAKELEIDKIDRLCIEEYYISKINEYGFEFKGNALNTVMSDELYRYMYSKNFIDILKESYQKYIDNLWSKFNENNMDKLMDQYKIEYSFYKNNYRDYFTLQYCIRRIQEEFIKKKDEYKQNELEYNKLKKKVEQQKSVISLLSDKKKRLIELREKLSLINNPNLSDILKKRFNIK